MVSILAGLHTWTRESRFWLSALGQRWAEGQLKLQEAEVCPWSQFPVRLTDLMVTYLCLGLFFSTLFHILGNWGKDRFLHQQLDSGGTCDSRVQALREHFGFQDVHSSWQDTLTPDDIVFEICVWTKEMEGPILPNLLWENSAVSEKQLRCSILPPHVNM